MAQAMSPSSDADRCSAAELPTQPGGRHAQQDEPVNAVTAAQIVFDAAVSTAIDAGLDPQVAFHRALNAYTKAQR